jgi:glycosyltransferase involved in cell wall biosynthesis
MGTVPRLRRGRSPSSERIYFLSFTADGADGICRTVSTVANELVQRHDVEIISLYKRRHNLTYPVDDRVRVVDLYDARPVRPNGKPYGGRVRAKDHPERGRIKAWLDARRSIAAPNANDPSVSLLSDLLIRRRLRSLRPGVLVSTRPSLHAAALKYAPRRLAVVGWEHMHLDARANFPQMMRRLLRTVPRLDGLVTLTEGDRRAWKDRLGDADVILEAIPNAVPWAVAEASSLDQKVVVSAGRFVERKGFVRLVQAYEPVARRHPDWQLHLYGRGEQEEQVAKEIRRLGVEQQVIMKGQSDEFDKVLGEAAIFANGAHYEGFGMVMTEALSKGVPLVGFDVPIGPREIVQDGVNGRLIPDGDLDGFAKALLQLIEDEDLRRQMGVNAQATARSYEIGAIGRRWDDLIDRVVARRR